MGAGIVLSFFGTSYTDEHTLGVIKRIVERVKKSFPSSEVQIAFTSSIIRRIWRSRRNDPSWNSRSDIPDWIFHVKSIIGALDELQERGCKDIVVQPALLFHGEEFSDLCSYVKALLSVNTIKEKGKLFHRIGIGRPILGTYGEKYPYTKDLERIAKVLEVDVKKALDEGAAILYIGHGNDDYSTGVYAELQWVMGRMYKNVPIFVGVVEGFPSFDIVLEGIKSSHIKKLLLIPLMLIAGDHVRNDMISWKSILEKEKIEVIPVIRGLGELDSVVDIIIDHLMDASKEAGIELL